MSHDVFISYSSKNKQTADAICHVLEQQKIKCWIAPRDISSGTEYSDAIPPAIKSAKVLIIVFSEAASLSQWVKSEIRIAFENNIPILPFRIDNTKPEGQFEVFLQGRHWIDAVSNPEKYFEKLYLDTKSLLDGNVLLEVKRKKRKNILLITLITLMIVFIVVILSNLNPSSNNSMEEIDSNNVTITNEITTNISYKAISNGTSTKLTGNVEGYEYEIELSSDQQCVEVLDQRDYNGDGLIDALIMNIRACGGNGVNNSFFFVSYGGTGYFKKSTEFGDSWNNPKIEKWENRWSVIAESNNIGLNQDKKNYIKERYILKDGKALLVESMGKAKLAVIKELRASAFHSGKEEETLYLYYDLDGDGGQDTIVCKYWERWDAILWEVHFSNGSVFAPSLGDDRIGILSSKTNGVNDLVLGSDIILYWNGSEYKEK